MSPDDPAPAFMPRDLTIVHPEVWAFIVGQLTARGMDVRLGGVSADDLPWYTVVPR